VLPIKGQTTDENHSLSFDGVNDYVDLSNKPFSGVQNQFSILSYVKTNSLSVNQGIYFHGGGYKDVGLRIDQENGEYKLHFFILTSTSSQGHSYAPVEAVNEGQWHHVAGTYDGQYIKLYIDGNLITETAFSADVNWDQGTQYGPSIGGGNDQCPTFDGNISEMSFWNTSLTQEQIQSNLDTELLGSEEGLVAHWNFNEGEGTTLNDLTGNGNHGTINGASWSTDVPVLGCTDPYAENYNSDANVDDGSCAGYPDNGSYSLSFDGVDDKVLIGNNENLDIISDEFTFLTTS